MIGDLIILFARSLGTNFEASHVSSKDFFVSFIIWISNFTVTFGGERERERKEKSFFGLLTIGSEKLPLLSDLSLPSFLFAPPENLFFVNLAVWTLGVVWPLLLRFSVLLLSLLKLSQGVVHFGYMQNALLRKSNTNCHTCKLLLASCSWYVHCTFLQTECLLSCA